MRREKMQSLKIVPVDGDLTHILELSLRPGNGRAFQIKRDMLMMAKDIAALKQCGIYFLYGETKRDGKLIRKVYVGQAVSRKNGEGVFWRIKEHDSDKPTEAFWTDAIAFVDRNNEWGPTEISYLENRFANLISSAKKGTDSYELVNGNTPNPGNVTKDMQWELESYIEDAMIILQTLRYDFFDKEEESEPSLLDIATPASTPDKNNSISLTGTNASAQTSVKGFPFKVGQVMSIAFRSALEAGLLKDEIRFLKSKSASALFKTGKYRIILQGEMPPKEPARPRRYSIKPAFWDGKQYWITTQIWEKGLEPLLSFLETHGMSREEIIALCQKESSAQQRNNQERKPKEFSVSIVKDKSLQAFTNEDLFVRFAEYLKTKVSKSSVTSYLPAFKTLEKMLIEAGVISKTIAECFSLQTMNRAQEYLSKDVAFLDFNRKHHHTYSAVWRKFENYIASQDSDQRTLWKDQEQPIVSEQDKTTSKDKKASVSVLFPDGTTICCKTVTKTFAETINRIGPERVALLNLIANGEPLVSRTGSQKYPRSNVALKEGFILITQSNTRQKISYLSKISELLGVGLSISIF